MTTPTGAPACVDCGAPATVEALRVGADNELLSDVAACAQHADPYLATATDVIHHDPAPDLTATPLPTHSAGPVPALGDFVQVGGRDWQVWDVQTTPAGGHEVTLFAENPDDGARWHPPGDLTTIGWPPADTPADPRLDRAADANLDAAHTWVPTPGEQDAIDDVRGTYPRLAGQSPRQALTVAGHLQQLAADETGPGPDRGQAGHPLYALACSCTPGAAYYQTAHERDAGAVDHLGHPGQVGTWTQTHTHTHTHTHLPDLADAERADLAQIYTWVPTAAEQDAIDWARAHADELDPAGPSPRQALLVAEEAHQLALDDADDLAADLTDLTDVADLGL